MKYSIVNYNTMQQESNSMRFDAEFFHPNYLEIENILKQKKYKILDRYNVKIKHPKEIKRIYVEEGIYFLRAQNVRPFQVELLSNPVYISQQDAEELSGNLIKDKDILITRTGANFGQCAIFLENIKAIASSHTFIVNSGEVNPFLLTVFLNTAYGRALINKGMYGGAQPEIAPYFLYQMPLPIFKILGDLIEKIFLLSQKFIQDSNRQYQKAEEILLSELGLLNWQPKHELTFVKNYSDTIKSDRLDAEYYQPKYEEIMTAIKNYKGGFDELINITSLVGHPSNPPYETENSNNKNFIIAQKYLGYYFPLDDFWKDEEALYTTEEFINKNSKFILRKDDLILYSVGAYIGKANLYNSEIQATIGSFLTLIRPKPEKINPFYLLVFLNSIIGRNLTRRNSRGLAQQYIYPSDTKKVIIPMFEEDVQLEIEAIVLKGQHFFKLSKALLEIAKQGVEMAIEEDEEKASEMINSSLEKLNLEHLTV